MLVANQESPFAGAPHFQVQNVWIMFASIANISASIYCNFNDSCIERLQIYHDYIVVFVTVVRNDLWSGQKIKEPVFQYSNVCFPLKGLSIMRLKTPKLSM